MKTYSRIKLHDDENWWDTVVVEPQEKSLTLPEFVIETKERYKTSSLSGDEWRFNYKVSMVAEAEMMTSETVNDQGYALSLLPWWFRGVKAKAFQDHHSQFFAPYKVTFYNRGYVMGEHKEDTLIGLLLGLSAQATLVHESEYLSIQDKTKSYCCQPGCKNPPVAAYKLKKLFNSEGKPQKFYEPEKHPYYRTFCTQHLKRGDCSLEDSDDNYEVVEGPGMDDSVVEPKKVSPSIIIY